MPVNWAFPAAQGEPESFLAFWFSVRVCSQMSGPFVCGKLNDLYATLRFVNVNPPASIRFSVERAQSSFLTRK